MANVPWMPGYTGQAVDSSRGYEDPQTGAWVTPWQGSPVGATEADYLRQQGQQAGKSLLEILQDWKAGKYGAVSDPTAKAKVLADLHATFTSMGASPAAAAQQADATFAREFAPTGTTPGVGSTTTPPAGPTVPATSPAAAAETTGLLGAGNGNQTSLAQTARTVDVSKPADPMEALYQTEAGPGNIFGAFLQKALPANVSNPYRQFLERQQGNYENVYNTLRNLGDIGDPAVAGGNPSVNYQQFLGQQGGGGTPGLVDPNVMTGLATRARNLLGGPETGLSAQEAGTRGTLLGNPQQQLGMAQMGGRASVNAYARDWLQRRIQDAFDVWHTANPTGGNFLQGFGAGTDPFRMFR